LGAEWRHSSVSLSVGDCRDQASSIESYRCPSCSAKENQKGGGDDKKNDDGGAGGAGAGGSGGGSGGGGDVSGGGGGGGGQGQGQPHVQVPGSGTAYSRDAITGQLIAVAVSAAQPYVAPANAPRKAVPHRLRRPTEKGRVLLPSTAPLASAAASSSDSDSEDDGNLTLAALAQKSAATAAAVKPATPTSLTSSSSSSAAAKITAFYAPIPSPSHSQVKSRPLSSVRQKVVTAASDLSLLCCNSESEMCGFSGAVRWSIRLPKSSRPHWPPLLKPKCSQR
jgi:hypothetical protein